MPDVVTVNIDGLAELEQALTQLGQEVAAKSIVAGAYNANKVLQDAARANIISAGAYDTGLLHNSIKRKRVIYDQSGTVVVITGIDSSVKGVDGKGRPRVPWRYGHIVHNHKPFMQAAYDSTKDQVVENFIAHLKNKIAKHTKG